jgi:predicted S18 family serine protease
MATFDKNSDVIDSRDVIARIEELESLREDLLNNIDELKNNLETIASDDEEIKDCKEQIKSAETSLTEWDDSDEGQELKILKALADEAGGCADWQYGETLIRDSYFQEYAEQLADDLGYLDDDKANQWPFTCIDWERAARELQYDYTSVTFDDIDYWIRS